MNEGKKISCYLYNIFTFQDVLFYGKNVLMFQQSFFKHNTDFLRGISFIFEMQRKTNLNLPCRDSEVL